MAGYFEIGQVLVGTYRFVARKDGYYDDVKVVRINSRSNTQQDFILYTGLNCDADCTDQNGYCAQGCDGLSFTTGAGGASSSCNFAHQNCAGKPRGFKTTFMDVEGNLTEVTCCEGPVYKYPPMKPTVKGVVRDIFDQVTPVKINGKTYLMHILVWTK
jgi:hypothetical protein